MNQPGAIVKKANAQTGDVDALKELLRSSTDSPQLFDKANNVHDVLNKAIQSTGNSLSKLVNRREGKTNLEHAIESVNAFVKQSNEFNLDGLMGALHRRGREPLLAPPRDPQDIIEGIFMEVDELLPSFTTDVKPAAEPFVAGAEQSLRIFQAVYKVISGSVNARQSAPLQIGM